MAPIAPNILRTELQCGASDLHWHAYLNCLWEWQESDISFEEYPWDDKMDHHARVCIEEYFSDEPSEKRMERKDDFRDDAARRIRGMRGVCIHTLRWTPQTNDHASHRRITESTGLLRGFHHSPRRKSKQAPPKQNPRTTSKTSSPADPSSSSP